MKISGIPIKLHISFLLILPFLAWAIGNNIQQIAGIAGLSPEQLLLNSYLLGLILAVFLFISVLLHELSHSFVARSKGMQINDITLMILGGVAQMEEITENPRDEAWMAFAGPLFSIVFGLILIMVVYYSGDRLFPDLHLVLLYLGQINIFLGIFNLLPAFPSDGGRILRSLIARKTSYLTATRIASTVGKAFALVFIFFGLLSGHILLALIGFFIFIGASQEYQTNLIKDTLSDFKVRELMTKNVSTVNMETTVNQLLDKMIEERHSGYPVIDEDGNIRGCVTMEDIKSIPPHKNNQEKIKNVMTEEVINVHPEDNLYQAFVKLSKADIGRLMVMENDRLVGILTRSDIMKGYRLKLIQEQQKE